MKAFVGILGKVEKLAGMDRNSSVGDGGSLEIRKTPPLAKRPIMLTWSTVLSYPIYKWSRKGRESANDFLSIKVFFT